MEIHLLQKDHIKEEALSKLLVQEGYKIKYTGNGKVSPRNIFAREKPLLILLGANFLASMDMDKIIGLFNKKHHIILLGMLKRLYWLFEFPCDTVGFICQNEKITNLYEAIYYSEAGKVYLSQEVLDFLNLSILERQEKLFGENLSKHFTQMEVLILKEIGRGKKSIQIAKDLFKSVHTINNHRKNIARKLSFDKKLRVIKFCVENNEAILTLISLNQNKDQLHQWIINDHK